MKKLSLLSTVCMALCLFMVQACYAASPVGTWVTIDDKTHKQRSIIKITSRKGKLYGRIIQVFKQPGDTGFCRNCKGQFKDKPVKGLQIMWDLKETSDGVWDDGHILDPKNGKVYNVKLTLSPNGKRLNVRGYVGFSLLGRTQVWHRKK